MTPRSLCIVVCAAGPAAHVGRLVKQARREGWTVRLVATPSAISFINTEDLAAISGSPVRHDYRAAGESGPRASTADAIIVAPATYNSINKLASGVNDTYALNVVAEAIGRGRPVAILPFVNSALAARRPFVASVQGLRSEGVHVVLGPDEWMPHEPGDGDAKIDSFPWHLALAAVSAIR
jgi:phosphopantothenoylcysteine synthetase/decarboxylase